MSTTRLSAFDTSIRKTNVWLKDVMKALGSEDRQQAYRALRATLHALRDALTLQETAQLAAQLPMLVRGFYYEGWRPSEKPRVRSLKEFLNVIQGHMKPHPVDAKAMASAVFSVVARRVSDGEIDDIKHILPKAVRDLWPSHGPAVYLGDPQSKRSVGELMTRGVLYSGPARPLELVLKRMNEERVRHLVVVDPDADQDGRIPEEDMLGMLTSRDVLTALERRPHDGIRLDRLIVQDVMTMSPLVTISSRATSDEAAALMCSRKISALPVIDDGLLVGLITSEDILAASAPAPVAGS